MPLFRNPVRIVGVVRFFGILFGQSFPQGGALLYYLYCSFPNLSVYGCYIRFSEPAQIAGMPLFRNPVRTKLPAGRSSSLLFILFFYPNLSVCGCCIRFSDPLKSQACRFFGILFGQSFPLRRFTHCGTADRHATNVPRRILQTMFRSVTIFMRSTVSGNSLLPNRFSDRAHNFSNAHRERITAAASFFSSEKVRKTDGTAAARSQSFRSDAPCKVTPSEQIMPERHYRKNFSLKKCTAK